MEAVATEEEPLEGDSLGFLGPDSGVRLACRYVATHPTFDTFIVVLIAASSVCLALDVPRLDPASELKRWLIILNYWFTGFFILEMMLKIVAYGFLFAPKAYLKDGWNILDFCIVIISILGLLASIVPAWPPQGAVDPRVLRPLRLLQRDPGKLIIVSLVKTLPSVGEVTAVVLVLHVVFAIMGMQLFSGTFGSCTDPSITVRGCFEPTDARCCAPTRGRGRRRWARTRRRPLPPPPGECHAAAAAVPSSSSGGAMWPHPEAGGEGASPPTPTALSRSPPPLPRAARRAPTTPTPTPTPTPAPTRPSRW